MTEYEWNRRQYETIRRQIERDILLDRKIYGRDPLLPGEVGAAWLLIRDLSEYARNHRRAA